jgi:hypothetical protein
MKFEELFKFLAGELRTTQFWWESQELVKPLLWKALLVGKTNA